VLPFNLIGREIFLLHRYLIFHFEQNEKSLLVHNLLVLGILILLLFLDFWGAANLLEHRFHYLWVVRLLAPHDREQSI